MSNLFLTPRYIITGKEALNLASENVKQLGEKALIVTDDVMVKIGSLKKVTDMLDSINIEYAIYSKVNSEPTDIMVNDGTKAYKEGKCDFLIGLGGGSPIDTMKAVGAMITNTGEINDYLGKTIPNATPPLVALPTTAGTGSEATQFTIISDTKRDIKMLLKGSYLMPTLAIIDPIFTTTAPPNVTAATGLDALTHAIEAYTSKKSQPMSDTFALSAVKRITKYLLKAYQNGNDVEARTEMSIAALEAGIAFNNSSVTIVHGMSRPVGALYHVPHGLSNAILLQDCLNFALSGTPERFCDLAKAIGIYKKGESDIEAGQAFIKEIGDLCRDLNIQTLEEVGVNKQKFFENLEKMAGDALDSGSPGNTRRKTEKEDIINIYKLLWKQVK
ncbi:iron-containing alcohol dehydrogenase [Clostridium estertheticum]|uniref:iron-containing alcohol dehydrogenase n=1 Tax=Clostridium estertheticum TaxID=238834 RepID=UPI0013EEE4E4|nr:iron-containing alcohol dehydrogenase [Clostridium estertheticum]MBZ9606970.1 iron-containing alcohol dehydrogenase [Clostridium estertheticum]